MTRKAARHQLAAGANDGRKSGQRCVLADLSEETPGQRAAVRDRHDASNSMPQC
jgi:hypothetical protein